MSLNQLVVTTLAPIGVPVAYQTYTGSEDPYITFFTYLEQPEQHADDEESVVGQYVQVDLWGKGDLLGLATAVYTQMLLSGFRRKSSADLYEEDLKVHHKAIRYVKEEFRCLK